MEEKQRKRACLPRSKREPRTSSALPIQYAEFQKQGVKITPSTNTGKRASLPRSLSVSHKVSMNLH